MSQGQPNHQDLPSTLDQDISLDNPAPLQNWLQERSQRRQEVEVKRICRDWMRRAVTAVTTHTLLKGKHWQKRFLRRRFQMQNWPKLAKKFHQLNQNSVKVRGTIKRSLKQVL